MKMQLSLLVVIVFVMLAVAQFGPAAGVGLANGAGAAAATATAPLAGNADEADHGDAAVMIPGETEQLFQVAIAAYLLDTAGLHAMDDRINRTGVIEAGDAGVVKRINTVLWATAWPEELQTQVDLLKDTLSSYAEALANDDLEKAKPLATQAHELQHDLSHAVEHWVGEMTGSAERDESGH